MLDEILKKINEKGWEAYAVKGHETFETALERGPTNVLVKGKQYLVMPPLKDTQDETEVQRVFGAMEKGKNYPIIHLGDQLIPFLVFKLYLNKVLIKHPSGYNELFTYQEFKDILNYLDPYTGYETP